MFSCISAKSFYNLIQKKKIIIRKFVSDILHLESKTLPRIIIF